jgi:transcriptional antiterminator RfaH
LREQWRLLPEISKAVKQWYAVYTKPRNEQQAQRQLENQGFETCLPLICVQKKRRNRWQKVVEPLFARYLFIMADPSVQSIAPVRSTLGVVDLVRFGTKIQPVPETVIEQLRASASDDPSTLPKRTPVFKQGDRVRVTDGPFQGLEAVFQEPSGARRALILLEFLGRISGLHIGIDSLSPHCP